MIREVVGPIGILMLMSCAPSDSERHSWRTDPGWRYKWDAYRNGVIYGLNDKSGTWFAGVCDKEPMFSLMQGDYRQGVRRFTLTIDSQRWIVPAWEGRHGRGLLISNDDPKVDRQIVDAFARASRRIRFETEDGWVREFKPAPYLARMISECRSLRKRDPDAIGYYAVASQRTP